MPFFNAQDLSDILIGATLLGSGGGGATKNGQDLIDAILSKTDRVPYVSVQEIADDDSGAVLAGMGSPEAFSKYGFTHSPARSFTLLEEAIGKDFPSQEQPYSSECQEFTFNYAIPVETGPVAHFMSMWTAVKKGIAVTDGDGGGRAFPSLAMCTFAAHDVPVAPGPLVSEKCVKEGGIETLLYLIDPAGVDDLTRRMLGSPIFNNVSALSCFAMRGSTIKQWIVPGTLTRARDLGKTIREATNPVAAAIDFLKGYRLFTGQVISKTSDTSGGFDIVKVEIENTDIDERVHVLVLNENLLAWSNGRERPLAMAPDLICYMRDDGQPLSNVEIEKGQNVTLIGVRAPEQLRIPYFIDLFRQWLGDRFSYYGPYVPIEDLNPVQPILMENSSERKVVSSPLPRRLR